MKARHKSQRAGSHMKNLSARDIRRGIMGEQTLSQITGFQQGFTLIEIMAAISIIAIVLVSVYKLHAQTVAMDSEVRFYATAPMLAQKKLAEIESKSRNDISDDSGDFGDKFPNYSFNIVIDDVASKALGNVAEDLKRIDITVSFNNDEYTYDLRDYRLLRD
jgi:general secretion pathway protein I